MKSDMNSALLPTIASVLLMAISTFAADEAELEPPVKAPPFNNRVGLARAAYLAGNNEKAIKLYAEALAMPSNRTAKRLALMRRGNAYLDNNEPDKALADYAEALRLGACESCICVNRGLACQAKGQVEKALKEYGKAIALDPGCASAYHNRAGLYCTLEEYEKALADFSKALEQTPNDADTLSGRADTYLYLNENEKALADLEAALVISPTSTRALVGRATTHSQLHNDAWAQRDLAAAIKLVSEAKVDANTKYALGRIAWVYATSPSKSLRNGNEAVRYEIRACELDGWKYWGFSSDLAAAYAEYGDFDKAIKFQQRAIKKMPQRGKQFDEQKARLKLYQQHEPYRDVIKPYPTAASTGLSPAPAF